LAGSHGEQFFPRVGGTALANQLPDGSWPIDSQYHDSPYGSAYTTALMAIMLGASLAGFEPAYLSPGARRPAADILMR